MATLRNKRKLAAVTWETQEENPRNGQSRNTSVPRINEEYITQFSEEIEGRVTKKLPQEFSSTESRILGTLSKLDEFLLNQQIRTHSGTVPGTFRNTKVENQGMNEDESQSDPHPEVGPSVWQSRHSIDSDTGEAHDTMTGVIKQTSKGPHIFISIGTCRIFSNWLPTWLNRCSTHHETGNGLGSTKSYNSETNQREIQLRWNSSEKKCLTLWFSPFKWQGCLVALNCWKNKLKKPFMMCKDKIEKIITVNRKKSDNITKIVFAHQKILNYCLQWRP